jgi:aryl-alcohol dehydrogenase-like predicted oxidoreductase
MAAKVGLGTAQFGMDYGISNKAGQCSPEEAAKILALAAARNVDFIDTAPGYGNSETVLGSNFPAGHDFDVVTKTPVFFGQEFGATEKRKLRASVRRTLSQLGLPSVYGLLVHHADQLLQSGGEALFDEMTALRNQGLVQKIGVSVYTEEQIEQLCERYAIDLIQAPVNVFDQRLVVGGHLRELQRRGIEVHVRSVFLQGLVLMQPDLAPAYFDPIRPLLRNFHAVALERAVTPTKLALQYIQQQSDVDGMIIGVCSTDELTEILDILDAGTAQDFDYEQFSISDERMINPENWR